LADVDDADHLLRAAFGVTLAYRTRLERYLAIQPDGFHLLEDGGSLRGMVGALRYGAVAYLGMMAVAPAFQRRGVGRVLMDHVLAQLYAEGVHTVLLDATEAGAPTYLRSGFVDAGLTHEFVWSRPAPAPETPAVTVVTDEEEVAVLDGAIFGVERRHVWRRLFAEYPRGILAVRDAAGRLTGYLCVQAHVFGPWGARSMDGARVLLQAAVQVQPPSGSRVLVPGDNEDACAMLAGMGFSRRKSLRHMRRGPPPTGGSWSQLYGKGSYCMG
jgi:GNAT superfamily N-acetyltransferase